MLYSHFSGKLPGLIYKETMIKIYGMHTCPDCTYVEEQVEGNARYEIIDIGTHVKYLKEFLRLRDHSPVLMRQRKQVPLEFHALCLRTVQ